MSRTLHLTEQLIACRSVTPADGGCQDLIAQRLAAIGFECHALPFGPADATVSNLWALRRGRQPEAPVLAFAGHTDVVPTGPLELWHTRWEGAGLWSNWASIATRTSCPDCGE